MSREDFEVFDLIKAERKLKRQQRRDEFKGGPGWTRHHNTHWSYALSGVRLDYWPGPKKWRWCGRTFYGDVINFIKSKTKLEQLE